MILSVSFTGKEQAMYQQIKKLAEDALALQNKNAMETALREIVAMCNAYEPEYPKDYIDALAYQAALNEGSIAVQAGEAIESGDAVKLVDGVEILPFEFGDGIASITLSRAKAKNAEIRAALDAPAKKKGGAK